MKWLITKANKIFTELTAHVGSVRAYLMKDTVVLDQQGSEPSATLQKSKQPPGQFQALLEACSQYHCPPRGDKMCRVGNPYGGRGPAMRGILFD